MKATKSDIRHAISKKDLILTAPIPFRYFIACLRAYKSVKVVSND